MLAKMCSDCNKPNGQYKITPERQAVLDFLKDLPIRKVRDNHDLYCAIAYVLYVLKARFLLKEYTFLANVPSSV